MSRTESRFRRRFAGSPLLEPLGGEDQEGSVTTNEPLTRLCNPKGQPHFGSSKSVLFKSVLFTRVLLLSMSNNWWSSNWWQCITHECGNWNHGTKTCPKCGLKRDWASETVKSPLCESSDDWCVEQTTDDQTREQLSLQIDDLKASLKSLSADCHADLRKQIEEQIAEHKRSIIRLGPLSRQIDGCRGALERAQRRRHDAAEAMRVAQESVAKADMDIATATAELCRLEALTPKPPEMDTTNCIDSLESSCVAVIAEMANSGRVSNSLVDETKSYMCQLVANLKQLSEVISMSNVDNVGRADASIVRSESAAGQSNTVSSMGSNQASTRTAADQSPESRKHKKDKPSASPGKSSKN